MTSVASTAEIKLDTNTDVLYAYCVGNRVKDRVCSAMLIDKESET